MTKINKKYALHHWKESWSADWSRFMELFEDLFEKQISTESRPLDKYLW